MRVAVLSAEAVPYSKTGGLADVSGALPKALQQIGVDSLLITPNYRQTKGEHLWQLAMDDLRVSWRGFDRRVNVFYSEVSGSPTFLLDAPDFFHRDSIYGYREDYERFAFFNQAALALLKQIGKPPDIVHLNDWHCGFAAAKIAHLRYWDSFWRNTKTVFSIHNLAYQGVFGMNQLWEMGFWSELERNAFEMDGAASALKAGLSLADMLSTVSRTYAEEIKQPENGYGLDWLLRSRSDKLFGIVNGVDYDVWNPETDSEIPVNYNSEYIEGKRECKRELLETFHLPVNLDKPLFAIVTRLTAQKGIELIEQIAGDIIGMGACFIALGSGDKSYESFFQKMRDYAPRQVGVYTGYNEKLSHQIEAGADIFLMPSKFEPCGLNQMYSLRYGTVPIVRAVGGLEDTVQNFDRVSGSGNGFKFDEFSGEAFLEKVYEAIFAYYEPETWRKIQWNGMREDNSWQNAARNYLQLYRMTING